MLICLLLFKLSGTVIGIHSAIFILRMGHTSSRNALGKIPSLVASLEAGVKDQVVKRIKKLPQLTGNSICRYSVKKNILKSGLRL